MPTVDLGLGIVVDFPHEPYECQVRYMKTVISCLSTRVDGLLESPTGTGKTLSILCSTLAWLAKEKGSIKQSSSLNDGLVGIRPMGSDKAVASHRSIRVFYASRTHSQLAQVVKELNKTAYRSTRVVVMAARDQLCINPTVQREQNSHLKSVMCRALVAKHRCMFHEKLERASLDELEGQYGHSGKALDIEELRAVSEKHGNCPYYRSTKMVDKADLVLLPYNYVIDPNIRRINNIDLQDAVVIFDEAHNLESICEDVMSCDLSSSQLGVAFNETKQLLEALMEMEEQIRSTMDESTAAFTANKGDKKEELPITEVVDIGGLLERMEKQLGEFASLREGKGESIQYNSDMRLFPGQAIAQQLEKCGVTRSNVEVTLLKLGKVIDAAESLEGQAIGTRGTGLQAVRQFLSAVFLQTKPTASTEGGGKQAYETDASAIERLYHYFCLILQTKCADAGQKFLLRFRCLSAQVAMQELKRTGVRCVLVTSGTLSPLNSYAQSVGMTRCLRLQNEHVASLDRVLPVLLTAGPEDGTLLNGSYNTRQSASYVRALGKSIARVLETVRGGILVFFTGYSRMAELIKAWEEDRLWSTTSGAGGRRLIFVEKQKKLEFEQQLKEYQMAVNTGGDAAFFAVFRGKLSEGIDLSDSQCRVVILTAVPYPLHTSPITQVKSKALDDWSKVDKTFPTGRQWYEQEAHRAANQAIGRVLRHAQDFGMVLLLDCRFSSFIQLKTFPEWMLSATIHNISNFDEFRKRMVEFFKRWSPSLVLQQTTNSRAIADPSCGASKKRRRLSEKVVESDEYLGSLYDDALLRASTSDSNPKDGSEQLKTLSRWANPEMSDPTVENPCADSLPLTSEPPSTSLAPSLLPTVSRGRKINLVPNNSRNPPPPPTGTGRPWGNSGPPRTNATTAMTTMAERPAEKPVNPLRRLQVIPHIPFYDKVPTADERQNHLRIAAQHLRVLKDVDRQAYNHAGGLYLQNQGKFTTLTDQQVLALARDMARYLLPRYPHTFKTFGAWVSYKQVQLDAYRRVGREYGLR